MAASLAACMQSKCNVLFLLLSLTFLASATRDVAPEHEDIFVGLDVDDPCWFYKSEDPVLTCSVNSLDWSILWRRDDLFIGYGGTSVGNDTTHYNLTSYNNITARQEKMCISSKLALSSVKTSSAFRCENQGYSSSNIHLNIPDYGICQPESLSTVRSTPRSTPYDYSIAPVDAYSVLGLYRPARKLLMAGAVLVGVITTTLACIALYLCLQGARRRTNEEKQRICMLREGLLTDKLCQTELELSNDSTETDNKQSPITSIELLQEQPSDSQGVLIGPHSGDIRQRSPQSSQEHRLEHSPSGRHVMRDLFGGGILRQRTPQSSPQSSQEERPDGLAQSPSGWRALPDLLMRTIRLWTPQSSQEHKQEGPDGLEQSPSGRRALRDLITRDIRQ